MYSEKPEMVAYGGAIFISLQESSKIVQDSSPSRNNINRSQRHENVWIKGKRKRLTESSAQAEIWSGDGLNRKKGELTSGLEC